MAKRLTLRRRLSNNTAIRIICTPGGRFVYHYDKKNKGVAKCLECKQKLKSKRQKTASCAYGPLARIVRVFVIKEQKIVKALKTPRKLHSKPDKSTKVAKKQTWQTL